VAQAGAPAADRQPDQEEAVSDYWQQQEQLEQQQRIEEALAHAAEHRATREDILLLAWASGVKYQPKERQRAEVA
jgi:hypothetical protein